MNSTVNFKIVVAGSGGAGKTTLLRRYQSGAFIPASTTIGVNFVTQQIHYEGKTIVLSIWDMAGEERFKTLFPSYLRGAVAGLAVFDLTRPDSLIDLSDWISIMYEKNRNFPIILVGTKTDAVSSELSELMKSRATEFANDHNVKGIWYVSSKTGEGVAELFDDLGNKVIEQYLLGKAL